MFWKKNSKGNIVKYIPGTPSIEVTEDGIQATVGENGTDNFIINGGFDFWQRGTSFTTSNVYTADRFKARTINGTYQCAMVGGASLYGKWLARIVSTDATTKAMQIGTQIEYQNLIPLLGKTVTVSVAVNAKDTQPASTDFSIWGYYNTGENIDIAFGGNATAIPGSSSKTIGTAVSIVSWTFPVPTTAKSLVLNFGNIATKACASGSGFEISYIMLNIGTKAAPFKRAGGVIGSELVLCQRYYEYGKAHIAGFSDGSAGYKEWYWPYKVTKRSASGQTFKVYDLQGTVDRVSGHADNGTITHGIVGNGGAGVYCEPLDDNAHQMTSYNDSKRNGYSYTWTCDSEL